MRSLSAALAILTVAVCSIAVDKSALVAGIAPLDESCGNIESLGCGGGGAHRVPGLGFGRQVTHDDCLVCVAGDPALCHPGCNASLAPDVKSRYEAVVAAATRQDASEVLELSAGLDEFVFFNEDRGSIQILDCQAQSLVANLPLDREMLKLASKELPVMRSGSIASRASDALLF